MIRISLLGNFRALKVQEASLASNLSSSLIQEEFLMAKSMRGAPRYLSGREAMENPRIWAMLA